MNKKVDDRVFSCAKALLNSGTKRKEVSDYMQLSSWTISMIARCGSMEEYIQEMNRRNLERQEKSKKHDRQQDPVAVSQNAWTASQETPVITDLKMPGGTMSATYQFNRMTELLKKQNDFLELISNKLAFIVEQLS